MITNGMTPEEYRKAYGEPFLCLNLFDKKTGARIGIKLTDEQIGLVGEFFNQYKFDENADLSAWLVGGTSGGQIAIDREKEIENKK